ncbi:hypothetical protein HNQ60_000035 [Povalibacter uvarum]|uniref:DUF4062 domain-containing protein n=1 Tax=Povalibacter uvarum TaxID=732238 RepID=A0A841HFH4_9GAMM|nr:DUF4062 domain-containing protein [Povalibacter uvarum]MBB6091189.1 hypothetical protein [Povalibacter uvarum]
MAYSVYLSSTLEDLKPERAEVEQVLSSQAQIIQSYEASPRALIESCFEDIEKSDVYVLILGLRYGFRPVNAKLNPEGLSITELEYRHAVRKKKDCYVFSKHPDAVAAPFADGFTKKADPALIEGFRSRVNERAAEFRDLKQLSELALKGFFRFKLGRERGASALMQRDGFDAEHPAELRTDVAILCAKGTDAKAAQSINARGDSRFSAIEISPDDQKLQLTVSSAIRSARVGAFLITTQALDRMKARPAMDLALAMAAQRCGQAFLLLDGVRESDIPPAWLAVAKPIEATNIADSTSGVLNVAYNAIRECSPSIASDRRLGVPCVVVALTDDKARELVAVKGAIFNDFKDTQRTTRRKQFNKLRKAIQHIHADWPLNFYGQRPEDWKPFGPEGSTIAELLDRTFDRINGDQQPGSRERRLLREYRLQPRPYSFDDFCKDRFGSRAMMEEARDQGCLMLLDEIALLSPQMREHIGSFVSGHRVAVVSANPCDPAHLSTRDLLDEFSHLHVGSLFTRFRDQEDPRCELSLNSVARLQRWLRLVLPEFVNTLSYQEAQTELVARSSSELFGGTGP